MGIQSEPKPCPRQLPRLSRKVGPGCHIVTPLVHMRIYVCTYIFVRHNADMLENEKEEFMVIEGRRFLGPGRGRTNPPHPGGGGSGGSSKLLGPRIFFWCFEPKAEEPSQLDPIP